MIALHQRGQGIQEHLRAIQRIHVKLGFVFVLPVIRIKHRRNVLVMAFSADAATFRNGHGVSNHNSADMADAKNSQSGFDRNTGITPYPACAKTAFRMGANTLSAEIERTDGRIFFRRLNLGFPF